MEGATRLRVLAAVRAADAPIRVDELADHLALHPNTVRFHLDTLVAGGAVERSEQRRGGRGRPSAVYSPSDATVWVGPRDPVMLSRILLDGIDADAGETAHAAAWEAGRRWGAGRAVGERGSDPGPVGVYEAICRHLRRTGFDPDPDGGIAERRSSGRVMLRNCAFADLADTHQRAICEVHAGMLEGVRQAVDTADQWTVELQPFVRPSVCAVTVQSRRPGESAR